jgi:hypothetical protein
MNTTELIKRGLISVLPASIMTVNYQLVFGTYPAIAFCISWVIIMWAFLKLESKDPVMARYYRILSIAFLIIPISAMIASGKAASTAAGVDVSDAEKAGAAIGGGVVLFMSMLFSLPMAAIFHFAAKRRMKNIAKLNEKV